MNRGRVLVMVGAGLLIVGGFLPWISVPNLFGLSGPEYEGIEIGWEGDGFLTAGAGLALLVGELIFGGEPRRWQQVIGVVLAGMAAAVVLLDFRQIARIGPEAGFFAATDYGIYVTLAGALVALIGCLWRGAAARGREEATTSGSMV